MYRYPLEHYSQMHLCGCFLKRLASELVDGVKRIALSNVVWPLSICLRPEQNKNVKERNISSLSNTSPGASAFFSRWSRFSGHHIPTRIQITGYLVFSLSNYITWCLGSQIFRWQTMEILTLQTASVNFVLYIYYILGKTLANAGSFHISYEFWMDFSNCKSFTGFWM